MVKSATEKVKLTVVGKVKSRRKINGKFQSKRKPPKPFKSWLEHKLKTGQLNKLTYEPETVLYDVIIQNKKYTPDFVSKGRCIEVKGVFSDRAEADKYLHIRNSGHTVLFVFQNPSQPLPWAYRRKNGSRMTHADWADKHGFEWCSADFIPPDWTKP